MLQVFFEVEKRSRSDSTAVVDGAYLGKRQESEQGKAD